MRDRVTFQQRELDDRGRRLGPWADRFTLPAQLTWLRAGETIIGQRLQGLRPCLVTVYDTPDARLVDNAWRLVVDGEPGAFEVKGATPARQRAFRDVLAEAVIGNP
jgi:hypothetical protein